VKVILYLELAFGILFVIRTLQIFRARALISTSVVTKTGTGFVCVCVCVSFFGAHHPIFCSFALCVCVFVLLSALFLLERRQIDSLKQEVPLFLDRWILNLRLGSALPSAREMALKDHSLAFQSLMRPVFVLQKGRSRHALMHVSVLAELERLHFEPHAALARLENLRVYLRKSSDFRRKSGQATRQTAIQSTVMMILLLALMVFTLHRYGWKFCGDYVLEAGALSILGVTVMYVLSRKTRWKI
jgi:hypothetical protein